jgi:hypothetical protein
VAFSPPPGGWQAAAISRKKAVVRVLAVIGESLIGWVEVGMRRMRRWAYLATIPAASEAPPPVSSVLSG